MPEIPPRKSDSYAKSGEEMMDILVDDIMRYEEPSEQSELCPRTNIEMWNVSETTTPSYCIYWLYFTY